MAQTSGLTVRQFERQEVRLPVELVIADQHRRQVTFSGSSGLSDPHVVDGTSLDFSSGGAGLETRKHVPRGTRGLLRVLDPGSDPGDGRSPVVLVEHAIKVRRVTLSSHEPTYFIGVSFVDQTDDFDERMSLLLSHIETTNLDHRADGGAAHA